MSNAETITADHLTELLFQRFYAKCEKSFLRINAEVMVEKMPVLAAAFARILSNDKSAAGWHRAMNIIDDQFTFIAQQSTYDPNAPSWRARTTREATPDEVRVNVADTWDKDTTTELMEQWALTNAHYETGYAKHVSGEPLEVKCFKYHGVLVKRMNSFDTVLTDEYWRGLVAFSMIADWQELPSEALEFIVWAGWQKDLKEVAALSAERGTINPESLEAILRLKAATAPAIAEGVL